MDAPHQPKSNMPSLEDVEMGNSSSSSSSEIREVEMEDAGSSPEAGVESAQLENGTSNGHMTSVEEGKSDDDKSGDTSRDQQTTAISSGDKPKPGEIGRDQEMTEGSSDVEPVMPSVEPGESRSPAIAEEMTSPAVEAQQKSDAASPKGQRNVHPDYEPPTASQSIKMDKEIARLNEVLAEISPDAAQKVLKEKWRMFLFENYDEAHIAFILRAGLKNANATILERVLKDDGVFKDSLLKHAAKKPGFLEKVLRNASAETIADHVPEQALDHLIAERFKTVPGKTLIKWLATAERLGYKADDILDEEDESVSPNVPSRDRSVELLDVVPAPAYKRFPSQYQQPYPQLPQQSYQPHLANPYKDPLLVEQERQASLNKQQAQNVQAAIARSAQASSLRRGPPATSPSVGPGPAAAIARQEQHARAQAVPTGPLICTSCLRSFHPGAFDGYTYHITKKVCEKTPPVGGYKWHCANCLSGFTTKQGLDYHSLRKVCVGGGIAPPTPSSIRSYSMPPPINSGVSSQPPHTTSAPIIPPARPPMYIAQPPSQPPSQAPQPQNSQAVVSSQSAPNRPIAQTPQPPVQIPRPSLGTPRGPGRPKKEEPIRHSPSELTPEKRAALEKAIQDAETEAAEKIAAIPTEWTAEERQRRLTSINNANATKKSQIRRAHGVSLRMREKDKQARVAAGISPSASSRIQEFRASQSPAGSPPAASFSPINGNATSRPNPAQGNGYSGPPQPPTSYRPSPPQNAASRVYNQMSSQAPGPDVPLTHARQDDNASPSGFGILKASSTHSHVTPNSYASSSSSLATYQVNPNNKRKHGSQEPIGNGTAQLSMMELSTQDAAAKFAKGYQKKLAEREREDREKGKDRDTSMTDPPNGGGVGSRNNAAIDISSDSEEVELPVVKSVEGGADVDDGGGARKRSVGANMARRGEDDSAGEGTE